MRKKFTYTPKQLEEMDEFYKSCIEEEVDFDDYNCVCEHAEDFIAFMERDGDVIESSIPLLTLSAIVNHRDDKLDNVIKRDVTVANSVRLNMPLLEYLRVLIEKTKGSI